MLHASRMLMALMTVAVMLLTLALTTTVASSPTDVQPSSMIGVVADADGGLSEAEHAPSELRVRRGCWLVCWR